MVGIAYFCFFPYCYIRCYTIIYSIKNVGETQNLKLDIPSIVLSSLGFGGLLIGFTNQGNYGWTNIATYLPILIGIMSLILFTLRQLKSKEPF